jgi:hypothetical protein
LKHLCCKDSVFTTDNMITKQKERNKWWSNSWDEGEKMDTIERLFQAKKAAYENLYNIQ